MLVEVFKIFIRPILEYCAPLWDGALTAKSNKMIESVQGLATNMILSYKYEDYTENLSKLGLTKLKVRRTALTKKVALSLTEHPKFTHLFPKRENNRTRSCNTYIEPYSKTNRYKFSPIPHYIRMINENKK